MEQEKNLKHLTFGNGGSSYFQKESNFCVKTEP